MHSHMYAIRRLALVVALALLLVPAGSRAEAIDPPRTPVYLGGVALPIDGNFVGTWRDGPLALNGDGTVLVVGAPSPNPTDIGEVYVFTRPNSATPSFTQTAKLTPSDSAAGDYFGSSLAVSADGTTIVAVGSFGQQGANKAYIFTRPSDGWANTTETAQLTGVGFGQAVRLSTPTVSADGGVVALRASGSLATQQAVYVYERPGGGWATATETARLTTPDNLLQADFGRSMAISRDGATIAVGAPASSFPGYTPGVFIFVRPSATWTDVTATAKLTVAGGDVFSVGHTVAMSGDGSVIAAGSTAEDAYSGAVFIFERGAAWTTTDRAVKLSPNSPAEGAVLGVSLAMSDDGRTVVAGASGRDIRGTDTGAVNVFTRVGTSWQPALPYDELTLPNLSVQAQLGLQLALSGDGSMLVAKAYGDPPGPLYAESSVPYVFHAATEFTFLPLATYQAPPRSGNQ
jgi:hypothetical protein